jgi:hypothetical protein
MEIINGTPFKLDAQQALDKSGRRILVVMVKGTYAFPDQDAQVPQPAAVQLPFLAADSFEGEPGFSAPLFESDYATQKPRCDVLVHAHAHAPGQVPVRELDVAFRLGACEKWARVVGDRHWEAGLTGVGPGAPEPFIDMPITYGRAYGGSCELRGQVCAHPANPVGRGFAGPHGEADLRGSPLPNVEAPGEPVSVRGGHYRPWSFGPIGRSWQPRLPLAGTYDERWKQEVFPLLPEDFDPRYFQAAPPDQQIDYPRGGEEVRLLNLHPQRPHIHFVLPPLEMPLAVLDVQRKLHLLDAVADSVTLDVQAGRVIVVWRAQHVLRRSLREVNLIAAGSVCKRWWKSRVLGTEDCGCGGIETNDEDLAPVNTPLQREDEA